MTDAFTFDRETLSVRRCFRDDLHKVFDGSFQTVNGSKIMAVLTGSKIVAVLTGSKIVAVLTGSKIVAVLTGSRSLDCVRINNICNIIIMMSRITCMSRIIHVCLV